MQQQQGHEAKQRDADSDKRREAEKAVFAKRVEEQRQGHRDVVAGQ